MPQVVLLPLGPWLAEEWGFALVFALGTLPLLGILVAPGFGRAWHNSNDDMPAPTPSDIPVAGSRRFPADLLPPVFILLGVTLAGGALITFAPQMVSSPLAATGGLALLTITSAVTRWGVGGLADRHGTRLFMGPFVMLTAAGLTLVALAVSDPSSTRVPLFLVAMALMGICYGGLQNLTLLLSLRAVQRDRYDTASAVWNMGFDAGTGAGSVVIGTVAAGSAFPPALLVAAGISLLTLPLALRRGKNPS